MSPHLVRYIGDGTYWLHDLRDKSKYLDKNQFEDLKEIHFQMIIMGLKIVTGVSLLRKINSFSLTL